MEVYSITRLFYLNFLELLFFFFSTQQYSWKAAETNWTCLITLRRQKFLISYYIQLLNWKMLGLHLLILQEKFSSAFKVLISSPSKNTSYKYHSVALFQLFSLLSPSLCRHFLNVILKPQLCRRIGYFLAWWLWSKHRILLLTSSA